MNKCEDNNSSINNSEMAVSDWFWHLDRESSEQATHRIETKLFW